MSTVSYNRNHSEEGERADELSAGADRSAGGEPAERDSQRLRPFSRPTIYNYYATKEEILLDLLRRECAEYTAEMERDLRAGGARSRERFCRLLTDGLTRHERMLRMMSVNLNAIENNVAEERLVAFKRGMNEWFRVLAEGLERFFPDSDARERELFLHDHFCYVYGLYPVTHPSARQVAAMEKAGFRQPECFERLCYEGLLRLTGRL